MYFLVFLLAFGIKHVSNECPSLSGISLMHRDDCYSNGSYFNPLDIHDRDDKLICSYPNSSITTGEWLAPDGSLICNNQRRNNMGQNKNNRFRCDVDSFNDGSNISLWLRRIKLDDFLDGVYSCCLPSDCSDPSSSIITANIFRYIQIASFTVELHHNMTVYPQHYTLHCIKTGNNNNYNYSMYFGDTLVTNGIACNYSSPCNGSHLLYNSNATYDHIVNITWDAMTVSSGSFNQSVTGNHTYQCVIENGRVTRTRNIALKVPELSPSSLVVVNKTATSITVSWTTLDVDGYVINVTSDANKVQTVEVKGGSNNIITLKGIQGETNYSINIRAYQQLLGPASSKINIQTLPVISSINWTLISSITQLNNSQYRIDCLTTADTNPSTDVYWLVNGKLKKNSVYTYYNALTYNNTLMVYPDSLGNSVNVTCKVVSGGLNYSKYIIMHAPASPPNNVKVFLLNDTSIKVNWTSSVANGYVVDSSSSSTRRTLSTSEKEIVLTDLLRMSTYTISVYSYIDLPSINSTAAVLRFDVPSSVISLTVTDVSTTTITVNWTAPTSKEGNYVTNFIISHTSSCPELSSVNETVLVSPYRLTTTHSYTLRYLYSGMNYAISVRAGNIIGYSVITAVLSIKIPAAAPTGAPRSLSLTQPGYNLTWNEVNCTQRNGPITSYMVMISNSSITYNLTSTERHIILDDLIFGTVYNISVAAIGIDRGPFSDPIVVEIGIVGSLSGTTSATLPYSSPGDKKTRVLYTTLSSNIQHTVTPQACKASTNSASSIIGLSTLVGVLLMSLIFSITIHIYCFIRKRTASNNSANKEEIVMQVCEPYGLHSYQEREGDYEDSPNIYEEADYCRPN